MSCFQTACKATFSLMSLIHVGSKAGCRFEHPVFSEPIEKLTLLWKYLSDSGKQAVASELTTHNFSAETSPALERLPPRRHSVNSYASIAPDQAPSSVSSLSLFPFFFSPPSHSQSFMVEDNVEPNWLMRHRQSTGWHGQMSRALSRDAIGWQRENLGHWSQSLCSKDGAEPQRTM